MCSARTLSTSAVRPSVCISSALKRPNGGSALPPAARCTGALSPVSPCVDARSNRVISPALRHRWLQTACRKTATVHLANSGMDVEPSDEADGASGSSRIGATSRDMKSDTMRKMLPTSASERSGKNARLPAASSASRVRCFTMAAPSLLAGEATNPVGSSFFPLPRSATTSTSLISASTSCKRKRSVSKHSLQTAESAENLQLSVSSPASPSSGTAVDSGTMEQSRLADACKPAPRRLRNSAGAAVAMLRSNPCAFLAVVGEPAKQTLRRPGSTAAGCSTPSLWKDCKASSE
mmetsp:Transcript_6660/g.14544  ORF Transcript_6660/g.14544 Transcript_6660/m.14544 type:complete len:293 (+) Transcript_6660:269-1147(+)